MNELPETKFLNQLLCLDQAKSFDKEICFLLLDLWTEVIKRAPEIYKLRKFTEKNFELTNKVKTLYTSISFEIKNSKALELYGLFLINILGEVEEGNTMLKRRLNIKNSESLIDFNKLNTYDENLGIILISTEINTFGAIAYMNENASAMLNVPYNEMIGHDFNQFIPKPYSLYHIDHMLKYYKSCVNTELELSHASFLQCSNGYIFECNSFIRLTTFNNKAYFMVSFAKAKTTTRQIILISEEGQIYCHSSEMIQLLGLASKKYEGMNISDLITGMNLSNLPLFKSFTVNSNKRKLVFVHITKKIKRETVHLILIDTNSSLTEKGERKIFDEGGADCTDLPKSNENEVITCAKFKKPSFLLSARKSSYISTTQDIQNSEAFDEEKSYWQAPLSSVNSQSTSVDRSAPKYIINASKAIKKFQWILFFSILAMIGTNIGILVYIIDEVSHTNSLDIFSHLGQVMFYIGSTANIVRSIIQEIDSGIYNLTRDSIYYSQNIGNLSILQETVLNDKSQWKYCPSSKIVTENIIPLWEFDMELPYLKNYNLYDTITHFIQHGKSLLKYSKTKEIGYIYDSTWLMINSVSFSFHSTSDALSGLVECEMVRIDDASLSITLLLWVGIIILGICLIILLYFIIEVKIAYEHFWKFIKNSAVLSYSSLRQAAIERFISIHEIKLSQEYNLPKSQKERNNYIKTNIELKFCWRLIFFVIISIVFYLIIMLYLYKTCEGYMKERPKLLQNTNMRRVLLARIGYFTRDINRPANVDLYSKS